MPNSRVETSSKFATQAGFQSCLVSPDFLANLAMGMSVAPFSETCRLHLGLEKCRYLVPVYSGDTLACNITITKIGEPSSDNQFRPVTSFHQLFNQQDQCVFQCFKHSLFPANEMNSVLAGTYHLSEVCLRSLFPSHH